MIAFLALLLPAIACAEYSTRSPSFELIVLTPQNSTLNGTALGACHEGAAIEAFCWGRRMSSDPTSQAYKVPFYFNTSESNNDTKAADIPGILAYDLQTTDWTIPSAMTLKVDWTSNVAVPILTPSDPVDIGNTEVYFDADGSMYVLSTTDDTVDPPADTEEKVKQWYVCTTDVGYVLETLAWVIGKQATPQNPTCQKVEVKRVWI